MKYINHALMRYLLSLTLLFLFSLHTVEERCCGGSEEWDCLPWGLTKLGLETLLINYSCVRGANTHTHTHTTYIRTHSPYFNQKNCWAWEHVYSRQRGTHVSIWDLHGVMVWCRASLQGLLLQDHFPHLHHLFHMGIAWHGEVLFSDNVLEFHKS